jgi:hypothetical protein
MDVWGKSGLPQHPQRNSVGELLRGQRDHATHIGVGLLYRHAGLEPRECLIAEVPHEDLRAIELEWKVDRRIVAQEPEVGRHHTDDLPSAAVHGQGSPDHACVTAQATLPISVTQNGRLGSPRGVVLLCKPAADHRLDPEDGKRSVRHSHRIHLLRFLEPRH